MRCLILIIPVLTAFIFIMSGCENKPGCTDSAALNYDADADDEDGSCIYENENLQLKFNHLAGPLPMEYSQEFTLNSGRKIKFTRAQMYLSGFMAMSASFEKVYDKHLLVTVEDNATFSIGSLVSEVSVTDFSLAIGVDSIYNHIDPASFLADNALSANQENFGHWGWNPGYKFLVLEGMMDSTMAMNGAVSHPFVYHLGFEEAYKSFTIATDFTSDGTNEVVELNVDWLAFFNELDLPAENFSHMTTGDQKLIGHKILDSAPNAITLVP
jgi:hypothetical protein